MASRSAVNITISVWKALFLREAVHRLYHSRAAWVWLLLEPMVHVLFLIAIIRTHDIGGVETPVWLMEGLLGFFTFRRVATQCMNAVSSNQALFAYRQVKPVDAVLTRAGLEGFLMLAISVILFGGAALFGLDVVPADPLAVLEAFGGLWLLGLGFGLMASVARELVPEVGHILGLLMTPLYFTSGVMIPLHIVPSPYREWLMLNPIVHGLEAARVGFAPYYQSVPELDITYLHLCALITIFLGLALHRRFALRLASQ